MWHTGLARRAWTEAGVCGLRGRSAAGRVEEECPLLSDTVTAPGTDIFIIELYLLLNNPYSACSGVLVQHLSSPSALPPSFKPTFLDQTLLDPTYRAG